jgi:hypothetical protein
LAIATTVIAVSAITLLLALGAIMMPYSIVFAKKHSNGSDNNGNDQKQKDNPSNGSNPPQDQSTNSGDQSTPSDGNTLTPPPPIQTLLPVNPPTSKVDCSKTPNDPSCPPPKKVAAVDCITNPTEPSCQKTPPPNADCTKTPNDLSCPPAKTQFVNPAIDCTKIPKDPGCATNTIEVCTTVFQPPPECKTGKPKPIETPPTKDTPDPSCKFFPEQEKCKPDQSGNCPNGFFMNGDGHCVPDGPCPKGFQSHDNDESGTCWPKTPKTPCPPNSHRVGNHCEPDCPSGFHFQHFPFKCVKDPTCQNGFHYVNGKCVRTIVVHKTVVKHITSNSDENSMVTRNTKITEQLTVGQAIDGCKDLTKKSPDNALKKSCNIMMAAALNYCMTHTKLWLTDSNICSDSLYLNNVPRYIAENVILKLFPATIYNIRP